MKLKEWSRSERPRERLLEKGAENLNLAELLAILIRTGTTERNVVEVAQDLIASADGSIITLSAMDREHMQQIDGIGPDKAVTITAAFELGRRMMEAESDLDKVTITHPRMIWRLMLSRLKGLDHEECWVIYLNRSHYIQFKERLSSGNRDTTGLDIPTLVRRALDRKSSHVILVHNHPSGNPVPGQHDLTLTAQVKEALGSMGLSLMDHIVWCDDKYFSMADAKTYLAEEF